MAALDTKAFFEARVEKTLACWNWTGSKNRYGYGRFLRDGRRQLAHRFSFEVFVGPIEPGACVCHSCDNRSCVNPDHLWLGSRADNNTDRDRKGRQASGHRAGLRVHPERAATGNRNGAYTHPESRRSGEANGRAKLNAEKVATIRERHAAGGVTYEALGRQYGVTGAMVSAIVRGKNWGSL